MVAVVVDDGDTAGLAGTGEAALHAAEVGERLADAGLLHAHLARHRDGGDGVQRVVASAHRQVQAIPARGMGAAAFGHLAIVGPPAVLHPDVTGAFVGLCAVAVGEDAAGLFPSVYFFSRVV